MNQENFYVPQCGSWTVDYNVTPAAGNPTYGKYWQGREDCCGSNHYQQSQNTWIADKVALRRKERENYTTNTPYLNNYSRETFSTCQNIGRQVRPNVALLNKLYNDGILTENSELIRNPSWTQWMVGPYSGSQPVDKRLFENYPDHLKSKKCLGVNETCYGVDEDECCSDYMCYPSTMTCQPF